MVKFLDTALILTQQALRAPSDEISYLFGAGPDELGTGAGGGLQLGGGLAKMQLPIAATAPAQAVRLLVATHPAVATTAPAHPIASLTAAVLH